MDNKNNILSNKLNENFGENIKFSFVSKHSVLIVTEEYKCYEIRRSDPKNLFIISSDNKASIKLLIEESLVKELNYKEVIDFKTGFYHSIALTIDKEAYYWDLDVEGLFGEQQKASGRNKLKPVLVKENVIEIHCGSRHSLALTSNGDIYAWGDNNFGQIGNGSNKYQATPLKINALNGKKIESICCGSDHSLALTQNGRVYSWGRNDWGQLGISNNFVSNSPRLVELSKNIKKISCGNEYSLLLSRDGDIYVCGWKGLRRLVSSDKEIVTNPEKLIHSEKFIDIESHSFHSISAAKSQKKDFYIWGKTGGEVITNPILSKFECFDDLFEYYLRMTNKPTFGKVIKFKDNCIQNGKYENLFIEKRRIEDYSYGEVFEIIDKHWKMNYAIKKIKFLADYEKEFLKELRAYSIVSRLKNERIIKYFNVWLENDFIFHNGIKFFNENLVLHIQMELCDKYLDEIINEIKEDSNLFSNNTLRPMSYYIASEIFIEILEGVNFLHNQNPPIIHSGLNTRNIMLKIENNSRSFVKIKGFQNLKIADLDLSSISQPLDQKHSRDSGFFDEFLAPESQEITEDSYIRTVQKATKTYTRADIYSLGIILQKLFAINLNRDYEIRKETQSEPFKKKYREISHWYDKMTRRLVRKRPVNIEVILKKKHLWTMNPTEFNYKIEFEKVLNSNQSKTSYIFKVMEKKLSLTNKRETSTIPRDRNTNYDKVANKKEVLVNESEKQEKAVEFKSDHLLLANSKSSRTTEKMITSDSVDYKYKNLVININANVEKPKLGEDHILLSDLSYVVDKLNKLRESDFVQNTIEIFLKFYVIGLNVKRESISEIKIQYIYSACEQKDGKEKSVIELLGEKSKLLQRFWEIFPQDNIFFANELDCMKICKIRSGVEFLFGLIKDESSYSFATPLREKVKFFDKFLKDLTETNLDWFVEKNPEDNITKDHWWFFTTEFECE